VGHGKYEPAALVGDLAEELALQPFDVDNGERAAGFRGAKDVSKAGGNRDLDGFNFGLR